MNAPDPAAMIAKRVSQLNKEVSLRTLAAENLQRKRKLSEILGQAALLNDQQEQKKILKVSESAATGCSLPSDHASTAHRLGESSAGQHVREQLPLHLAAPHPRRSAPPCRAGSTSCWERSCCCCCCSGPC
ncbi:hypoxia-inducible factor 1-alpha-like [Genypterus blacodes]|uniref:hypoxia-inducible factor 1-alpha-like n=1 Tax=Genypterus blacodes TaxID=154954 RepID=UPI003F762C50